MLQLLVHASHARKLCAACLALAVAGAPTAFAEEEDSARELAEGVPEQDLAGVEVPQGDPPGAEASAEVAEPAAPPEGIEVIRIKGREVSDIDTEVPASVTQFDPDTILALGAQNVSDLAKVTPNLEIRTAGATAPTFFIRGVGLSDFNANAGGAVAVYQDGVALNSPALQLGQLFDVENIEVLRGPQGGGAGRNASAGAIKIHSRKPVGDLSASLNSSYGNYDYKDFQGALEFPLLEQTLSSRLAFRVTQRDGWGRNGCGKAPPLEERFANPAEYDRVQFCEEGLLLRRANPDPPPPNLQFSDLDGGLPEHVNDLGNWAARGLLRYQPEDSEMDWLLIARGGQLDQLSTLGQAVGTQGPPGYGAGRAGGAGGYVDPDIRQEQVEFVNLQFIPQCLADDPGKTTAECRSEGFVALGERIARRLDIHPRRGDYDRVGDTRLDTWGASLQGSLPVGPFTLTSISGYDAYDRFRDEDLDFTSRVIFESTTQDDAWQFSQELRLGGELEDSPLTWELGGYYLMEQLASDSIFTQPERTCPVTVQPCPVDFVNVEDRQSYTQDLWSFAFYAGFVWDFLDEFTLEAGVRYNWEYKTFDYVRQLRINSDAEQPEPFKDARTWQAPTGTLTLTYRPREDLSLYWKYGRGWKGGQFNASALTLGVPPAQPESLDSWETGIKGEFADGRLGLSAALFYYKYYDYQVFIVENNLGAFPQIQVINANKAQNYGAELTADLEPLVGFVPPAFDGLRVTTRFAWLESEFLDFTNEVVRLIDLGGFEFRELPVTLDYSGNPLINSPRFKLSLQAEWTFELGRFGSITPRYDGAWSDDVFFDQSAGRGTDFDLPPYAIGQPAFWLHNLALTYTLPVENIEITGWVRNLTDEAYKSYAFDASQFQDITINFVGEPRTFGGSVAIFW